eukprot:SAG11_NODE_2673_length_3109_cov_1.528904_1_plen_79_part_00
MKKHVIGPRGSPESVGVWWRWAPAILGPGDTWAEIIEPSQSGAVSPSPRNVAVSQVSPPTVVYYTYIYVCVCVCVCDT